MTAKLIHGNDLNQLAAAVNAARVAGGIPNGGLLFWKGQYFQLVVDGTSSVEYAIVARQQDTNFSADAQTLSAGGAFALGAPLQVDGYFVQAFGDQAGAGGGGGSSLPDGDTVDQTIQWDGTEWLPGVVPADAAIYGEDDSLGAALPTIFANTAAGYPLGLVVIDATGQTNSGLYVVDGGVPVFSISGSATGVNFAGPGGSLSLAPASAQLTGNGGASSVSVTASTVRLTFAPTAVVDVLTGTCRPGTTNVLSLGDGSHVWTEVFATNGTINTSDATYKTEPLAITDAVLDAVGDVDIVSFKMLDAVALKGDAARTHFGVIAQQVIAAFTAHGLDPFAYGVVCYDEWEATPEVLDAEGNVLMEAQEAGSRYAVRYDELLVLEAARVRRQLALLSS